MAPVPRISGCILLAYGQPFSAAPFWHMTNGTASGATMDLIARFHGCRSVGAPMPRPSTGGPDASTVNVSNLAGLSLEIEFIPHIQNRILARDCYIHFFLHCLSLLFYPSNQDLNSNARLTHCRVGGRSDSPAILPGSPRCPSHCSLWAVPGRGTSSGRQRPQKKPPYPIDPNWTGPIGATPSQTREAPTQSETYVSNYFLASASRRRQTRDTASRSSTLGLD